MDAVRTARKAAGISENKPTVICSASSISAKRAISFAVPSKSQLFVSYKDVSLSLCPMIPFVILF
jgi:hypothetical protein